MRHLRPYSALVLLALAAACGGGSAAPQPDGPVKPGVIAGNHQIVVAERLAALPVQPVVLAVQLPNGQVALRVLDAILPEKAYAQTSVQGVPNFPICTAQPKPGDHALKADIPCTLTDATGRGYLTILHDSVAGTAIARIGYSSAAGTVITDSVQATVMPGPVNPKFLAPQTPIQTFPATVPAASVVDAYSNPVAFRIVSDGRIVVQDTTTGSIGARTIVTGPDAQSDFVVELRGADNALVGHARYRITQGVLQYFMAGGVNTTP